MFWDVGSHRITGRACPKYPVQNSFTSQPESGTNVKNDFCKSTVANGKVEFMNPEFASTGKMASLLDYRSKKKIFLGS